MFGVDLREVVDLVGEDFLKIVVNACWGWVENGK